MFDHNYEDERAREVYLKRYLNSQGYELPEDYSEFARGAEREHSCVFCRNPHDNYELYQYNPLRYGQKRAVEGSPRICKDCHVFIDTMEMHHYPHLYESPIESSSPPMEYDLQETTDAETLRRIVAYNTDKSFDADVYKYYLYLDRELDHYAINHSTCYFCKTFVRTFVRIEVPMNEGHQLSGGYVPCCNTCFDKLYSAEDDYHTFVQRCDRCESHYRVNKDEYNSRVHVGTIGKHLCSECTYITQLQMSEASLLYIPENHERRSPMQRFKWQECSKCGKQSCLDITINLKHYSYNLYSNKYYCGDCVAGYKHTDNEEVVTFNERISILMKYELGYWSYIIYEKVNGKRKDIYRSADQVSKDDLECVFIAFEECTKLFTSKQLEIWPEVDLQDH